MIEVKYRLEPRAWVDRMRAFSAGYSRAVERGMQKGGNYGLASLRQRTIAKRKVSTGAFLRGWNKTVKGPSIAFSNSALHAIWVERGRRAGGLMPPISAISEWAARKLGDPRAAWPIARAIQKRGIKPTRILTDPKTFAKLREIVLREVRKSIDEERRRGA